MTSVRQYDYSHVANFLIFKSHVANLLIFKSFLLLASDNVTTVMLQTSRSCCKLLDDCDHACESEVVLLHFGSLHETK